MVNFDESIMGAQFEDILGQERVKEEIKSALLARRHVVLIGPPGVGKTTLARGIAGLIPAREVSACAFRCDPKHPACPQCKAGKMETRTISGHEAFVRVQGSPDLTAEDLLGDIDPIKALEFGPLSPEAFTPGKIFKANHGMLFFDEVNRCSEKLQNALLQVLEEGKVTIGSYDVDFPADFLFVGTMNPEDTSTEPLSDVFLDRFDLITMGYPETLDLEDSIVNNRTLALEGVSMPSALQRKVIGFIRQLRMDSNVERKPSVRASIGVIDRAKTTALLRGNKVVGPEEIEAVIASVLSHRMSLKPSIKYLEEPEKYLMRAYQQFARDHDLEGGDP